MTIKEYLGEGTLYDALGVMIFCNNKQRGYQLLCDVRGWGAIQYLFDNEEDAMRFQDSIGQFISDAINEKLEREQEHNDNL